MNNQAKNQVTETIAQQLNIKEFPFIIKDQNDNVIYHENSDGYWYRKEFDANGNQTYIESSEGDWVKREFDANGSETYYEDSEGKYAKTRIIHEFSA